MYVINEDVRYILDILSQELRTKGILLFADCKTTANGYLFTCPQHKGGQERKPSCGVITENKESMVGWVHCFTCGYSVPFEKMISDCFNIYDTGEFGKQWLISHFIGHEDERELVLDFGEQQGQKQEYVSEEELDRYRFTHPYMFKRKLTDKIIEDYDIGYDKSTDSLTFPVRDKQGRTLFIVRRSVTGKFYNMPETSHKTLYGAFDVPDDVTTVLVCESVLDALWAVINGIYAVALLGTGTKEQIDMLKKLPFRKYVLALDGDEAGRRGSAKLYNALKNHKVITYLDIPDGKDINDLTRDELLNLKEVYAFFD